MYLKYNIYLYSSTVCLSDCIAFLNVVNSLPHIPFSRILPIRLKMNLMLMNEWITSPSRADGRYFTHIHSIYFHI